MVDGDGDEDGWTATRLRFVEFSWGGDSADIEIVRAMSKSEFPRMARRWRWLEILPVVAAPGISRAAILE